MKYMPEHVWRSVEKEGRQSFIWKHRLLPFGIPGIVVLVVWAFWELQLGWSGLLHAKGLAVIYLTSLAVIGIGYFDAVNGCAQAKVRCEEAIITWRGRSHGVDNVVVQRKSHFRAA